MSTANVNIAVAGFRPSILGRVVTLLNRKASALHRRYFTQVVLTSLPLIAADSMVLGLAALGSQLAVGPDHRIGTLPMILPPLAAALFLINTLLGLYPGVGLNPVVEFRQSCISVTVLFGVYGAATLFRAPHATGPGFLIGAWFLSLSLIPVMRSSIRATVGRFHWWGHPAIVFGSGRTASRVCRSLTSDPSSGLRPVGLVDDAHLYRAWPGDPAMGLSPAAASATVRNHGVYWAIVAMPEGARDDVLPTIERVFLQRYPRLLVIPHATRLPSLWNRAHDCCGMPGIRMGDSLLLPLPRMAKRVMDLAVAIIGGLLASPVIALIGLLIKTSSPGPVFYGQKRIGCGGRRFRAWKFRTMVADADQVLEDHLNSDPQLREEWDRDHKLKNDPRVTWIGRWLRKSSLDELPQIWNVLLGQMSLVGPRPIVDAEIEKYAEAFHGYTKVIPGITGLWQISGRNNTTYEERVDLDSYYVRNWSPWFDIYILIRTIKVVLLREGAY